MRYTGKADEYFEIVNVEHNFHKWDRKSVPGQLFMLWFLSDGNELTVDNRDYTFSTNDVVFLTEFHQVEAKKMGRARLLKWNKDFYCIINHDSEVGCKGILFYGAAALPVIRLSAQKEDQLRTNWDQMEMEMRASDTLKEEMLQMLLKRILILCTRIYKDQTDLKKLENGVNDIVREYNFLVEQYFKVKHTVSEYASLMYKSPKTLANMFKKLGTKTPLQFIKDRKMLEARRLLIYTDKTISEISYDLGFSDVQSFSRFFKKEEGVSPQNYRN